MRKLLWLAILALAAAPALAGLAQLDRTVPIGPDGTVELEIIAGTVEIVGGDGSDAEIHVSYDDRYLEVKIQESGRGVEIVLEPIKDEHDRIHGRHLDDTVVQLRVPRGASLDIESVSADTTIENTDGTVEVDIVSGDLEISGGEPEVSVDCVSGDVRVRAETMLRGGDFECVSGDLTIHAPLLGPGARLSFETVSGDVELRLSSAVSAEFEIETFSGDITNELGPAARRSSDFLPAKELRFTLGSGDARISGETLSGHFKLVRD
jgi:hypothetical protein